jgi:hypothetical protein
MATGANWIRFLHRLLSKSGLIELGALTKRTVLLHDMIKIRVLLPLVKYSVSTRCVDRYQTVCHVGFGLAGAAWNQRRCWPVDTNDN